MTSDTASAALVPTMATLLQRRQEALDAGATSVGWKIGINVPALQAHFGLSGPIVGYLTDATVVDDGTPVSLTGWTAPALEVEVAVRVGPNGTITALAPALELVDLNLSFDADAIGPILAGNVFHRGVIFGPEHTDVDVSDLQVQVTSGADVVATGALTEAPEITVGLVRTFLETYGAVLSPGDRIIAGSLFAPMPVAPGNQFDVSFGPLGHLNITFT